APMGNGDDVFLGDAPIIVLREYVSQDLAERTMNSVRMPQGLSVIATKLGNPILMRKLVLMGDDGKPLKPCKPTPPSYSNVVSEKVNDLVNEVVIAKLKRYTMELPLIWLENHDEDLYDDDDFNDPGLTDALMKFANTFDINLRGQLR
ncbi:hypothetical protein Tco_1257034, partial [Tanacetum coccineum]